MTTQRMALAAAFWLLVLLALAALGAGAQSGPLYAPSAWSRGLEPVIVHGDQLPLLEGAPLDRLSVHVFSDTTWTPIAFQIDEVNAGGMYTEEDHLLDGDDELVLMAMDLGAQAAPEDWLDDPGSRDHPRYEIEITNPLTPTEKGWAYVYRSETLTPTLPVDYVDWDPDDNAIVAGTYVLGFEPTSLAGIASLELNSTGIDVLDRSKIRLRVTCYVGIFPVTLTLTEEDLAGDFGVTPSIDGPVRVGGGHVSNYSWAYRSLYWPHTELDVDGFPPPPPCTSVEIHWMRFSEDWLDPSTTGMAPAAYYDANTPAGVAIDGLPDDVPATPPSSWHQVSGSLGSTVRLVEVSLGGGSVSTYYKDDATPDSGDTGDGQSYADAGFRVDAPSGQVTVTLPTFVLPANEPVVGPALASYLAHPLQVEATAQQALPPCEPNGVSFDWGPRPVQMGTITVFTGTVGGGAPPFTYTWAFADDGSIGVGNPQAHTFAITGTFPVTLTASNECGVAPPVVHGIEVLGDAMGVHVYLPLAVDRSP